MILSDKTIKRMLDDKTLAIDPAPSDVQLQPASVDVRLGTEWLSPYDDEDDRLNQKSYLLMPGECILATTLEYVEIPDFLVARVEGRSSWGRKFIQVHSTAGFIDPGFCGNITLELTNLSSVSQLLRAEDTIAQLTFELVDQAVERPYGSQGLNSQYQDQLGVVASAEPWN